MSQTTIALLALSHFALLMIGFAIGSTQRATIMRNYRPHTAPMPEGSLPPKPRK